MAKKSIPDATSKVKGLVGDIVEATAPEKKESTKKTTKAAPKAAKAGGRVETRGRKPATTESKSESCTLLLRKSTKAKLNYLAWKNRTSFNEYLTRILENYLDKQKEEYPENVEEDFLKILN